MNKLIITALVAFASAAYAQTAPLKTSDVAVDANGICWVRGPANVLVSCKAVPVLGTPVAITSATQVLPVGNWLIVSGGSATVVISDGTAVTGVATGNAYPV